MIIIAHSVYLVQKLTLVTRAESFQIVAESMSVIAAILLLLSVMEFLRNKNQELMQARMESRAKADFFTKRFQRIPHTCTFHTIKLQAASRCTIQ